MRNLHTTAAPYIRAPYSIEVFQGPYKTRGAAVRAMHRMADQVREVSFPGIPCGSRRAVTTVRMTDGMMRVVERSGGWSVRVNVTRVHLDVRITDPGGRVRTLPLDMYEAEKERAAEAARARAAEAAKAFTARIMEEAARA